MPAACDVLVIGAGNAGLCAAIAARQAGARVLVLERAPRAHRGGNSALTMNLRFAYESLDDLRALLPIEQHEALSAVGEGQGSYPPAAFLADLLACADGRGDRALLTALAERSYDTVRWLRAMGHRWEVKPRPLPGSVPVRLAGGGAALQERAFAVAESLGIDVVYEARATALRRGARRVRGARVERGGESWDVEAGAVVLANGGFQGDAELRARFLGPAFRHIRLRGVRHNVGDGHRMALAAGAAPAGDWSGCHAPPQEPTGPADTLPGQHELCQAQSRYSFQYGITVDRYGRRFVDEGATYGNLTYGRMGREILVRAGGLAWQIFDGRSLAGGLVQPSYRDAPGAAAGRDLPGLARALGIDPAGLARTVAAFNASIRGADTFAPGALDGAHTEGLDPPKSHWAVPLDTPPFVGFPVGTALTFTYGGVRIDADARCLDADGAPVPGLYAAGELVGGLFFRDYPGGSGMMAGATFGRGAGEHAAREVR